MDIQKIQVPTKIFPSPVREAIIEMRFDSHSPSEIILGILYNKFRQDFANPPENLPILEFPRSIREQDKNLKYSPHYQFTNEDYILRIAPKAISVACNKEYKGWTSYSKFAKKIFCDLEKLNIIEAPQRIGLRYISFFDGINIFEKLEAEMKLFGKNLTDAKNTIRCEFSWNELICVVHISNDAVLMTQGTLDSIKGSSIDIDVIKNNNIDILKFESISEHLHEYGKQLFFNLLSKSFLKELKPEYK
jgi:uncharacterized protein (TIGR04255 family)